MLRILFNLFRKQFLHFAFHSQSKPSHLAKTEFCFIDSNGKRYYRFTNDSDLPIERWSKIQELLAQLGMALNNIELKTIIEFMDISFNNPKKPDLAAIGYSIQELKFRQKAIVHKPLMMELMGAMLIREDQLPHVWDNELEQEKLTQFSKDIASGGIADFFEKARLGEYIPYLNGIKKELPELLEETDRVMEKLNLKMKEFTSDLK